MPRASRDRHDGPAHGAGVLEAALRNRCPVRVSYHGKQRTASPPEPGTPGRTNFDAARLDSGEGEACSVMGCGETPGETPACPLAGSPRAGLTAGMGTVGVLARSQLARHWRRTVGLAIIVGFALGVVLAAAAGARRTQTALERFVAHSRLPDAAFFGPLDLIAAAARLPEVRAGVRAAYVPLTFVDVPEEERERLVPFASLDADHLRRIERPFVVSGRLPIPGRVDEIAVSEKVAERRQARPGSVLRARAFADAADLEDFKATGPLLSLRVTGVVRQLADLARTADDQGDFVSGEEMVYLTPAFWRAHVRGRLPGFGEQAALLVDLLEVPGAVRRFQAGVLEANGGELPGVDETAGFFDPLDQADGVRRAVEVSAASLYAFATMAGFAVLFLVGQALARQAQEAASAFPSLSALGLSRRQLVGAAAARYAVVGVGAAFVGTVLATGLSSLAPFGLARLAEPHPGVVVNAAVIAGGAAAGMAAIVLTGAVSTWLGSRPRPAGQPLRVSSLTTRLIHTGASVPAVVGTRFALEPGRGAAALPVRTTLTAGVLAAALVATALTFSAGFDRVLAAPRFQGAPWDLVVGEPRDEGTTAQAILALDERVDAVADLISGTGAGGETGAVPLIVLGIAGDPAMHPPVARGRRPGTDEEVAVTSQTARRLGIGVGDAIRIGSDALAPRSYRVVGIVPIGQQLLADRAGLGVLVTHRAAGALAGKEGQRAWAVRWKAGVDQTRARDDLRRQFDSAVRPFRSPDVRNLARVRWLPNVLAVVLGILGFASLAHTLVAAVRRRARDLALLKTLGLDRRQVGRTVRWQALTNAAIGAGLGLPAGVVAGRWIWRLVGERIGVAPEAVTPWLAILVAASALLTLAVVVAAVPARMAARTSPAQILRTE